MMAAYPFTAHMLLHMAMVAVVPPLLVAALAGGRFDPASRWPASWWAAPWWPLLASAIEFLLVWGWHLPGAHLAARNHPGAMLFEQAVFLGAGLLLWLAAFGGHPTRARAAAGILALLLTATHMTLLGVLLATAPRVLYPHAADAAAIAAGALRDQQMGGVLMLALGGAAYLLGALALLRRVLRHSGGASS